MFYKAIVFLPLIGAIAAGLFSLRKLMELLLRSVLQVYACLLFYPVLLLERLP